MFSNWKKLSYVQRLFTIVVTPLLLIAVLVLLLLAAVSVVTGFVEVLVTAVGEAVHAFCNALFDARRDIH